MAPTSLLTIRTCLLLLINYGYFSGVDAFSTYRTISRKPQPQKQQQLQQLQHIVSRGSPNSMSLRQHYPQATHSSSATVSPLVPSLISNSKSSLSCFRGSHALPAVALGIFLGSGSWYAPISFADTPINRVISTSQHTGAVIGGAGMWVADASLDKSAGGASLGSNTKIKKGGASTLQQGIAKTITRGVNLDGSDFEGQNLKGVAFQQSIVRDSNFKGCNLYSASFFDATLDGSNFEGADLTLANVELAQFNRAILKNAILKEMYVVGATNFDGVGSIEGSDWTDTVLSPYQRKYLCALPSATGTNPFTGADTRESLMCP